MKPNHIFQIILVILPPYPVFIPLLSIGKINFHEFTERKIIAMVRLQEDRINLSFMNGTSISHTKLLQFMSFQMIGYCLEVSVKMKAFIPLWYYVSKKTETPVAYFFFFSFSFFFLFKSFRCIFEITKMLEIRGLKMSYLFSDLICFYKGINYIVTVFNYDKMSLHCKTVWLEKYSVLN